MKEIKQVNELIRKISDEFAPSNGCENCWGDLHQGCTEECVETLKKWGKLFREIDSLKEYLITECKNAFLADLRKLRMSIDKKDPEIYKQDLIDLIIDIENLK